MAAIPGSRLQRSAFKRMKALEKQSGGTLMSAVDEIESRTIGRVSARLVPFLILCYFVAYLDRVNVGFAALTMNKDLGLTASAFGFGAGIFFLTYFVFEVPSNLFLERFEI